MRRLFLGLVAAVAVAALVSVDHGDVDGAPAARPVEGAALAAPPGGARWEPLGGVLAGGPAVASWGPGRLDVFVTGTDGQLWHRWYDGGWSVWEPLGGRVVGRPAVAAWASGRLDVFVMGTDGQLWHRWYDGGWSVWEPLGGRLDGGPAVAAWASGRLDVFVTGTDGQLWHLWYDGRWSWWEPLGGVLRGEPAVAAWGPGRLDVFGTGTDGQVWHRWYDGRWSWWEPLGGRLDGGPAVAAWGPGRLDVFGTGTDGQVWHRWYDGRWSIWESLGGRSTGGPAVASWGAGRLDVFARGTDQQLHHTWHDGDWPPAPVLRVVIDGTGNGHGRGLSQWGSYGWAVNYGRSWQQILGHYYGGTTLGSVAASESVRVRLLALDDAPTTGVISTAGTAMWDGIGYGAVQAWEVGPNTYEIWTSPTPGCPGPTEGWTYQRTVPGPVTFTTSADQSATAPGDVLGLCQPNGSIVHYRGSLIALNDAAGANRTVNEVLVDNYLRGVVPREVPASWGNSGQGRGMHALRAQTVAARSFGLSQGRYPYARTCDSSSCQVYGGSASRSGPLGGATVREHVNTDAAVAETSGVALRWPNGAIVSAEFSASNGPRTAGGVFPAVDDPADDVAGNPNHRWNRQLDAAALAARYALGELVSAATERDPASPYDGIWANRVRLRGTTRTVVVSAWDFRNAFGLPSPGFVIRDLVWS